MSKALVPLVLAACLAGGAGARSGSDTQIVVVSPASGSTVHTERVPVVVRVTSATAQVNGVQIEDAIAKRVGGSLWRGVIRVDPGVWRIHVHADDGSQRGTTFAFRLTVVPPVTAIQGLNGNREQVAPGCTTCVVRDPRGDDRGGPPDIASVSSTYKGGWITFKFITYDAINPGHGGHPCIDAFVTTGPNEKGFGAGCFEGPHTGMVFGALCAHPDAAGDCGSAHMSFPNSHTTVYRIRPGQIGNPAAFSWNAWVVYPGDAIKDTAPSAGDRPGPGQRGSFCVMRQQLRPEPLARYGWGKRSCSQARVVVAK